MASVQCLLTKWNGGEIAVGKGPWRIKRPSAEAPRPNSNPSTPPMPILPSLSAWAAAHLTSVLESKTKDKFDAAFDATFAADCNITFNGTSLSRDAYKAKLLAESAAAPEERDAAVTIEGQTEVETGNQGQLVGNVSSIPLCSSLTKVSSHSLGWLASSTRRCPIPISSCSVPPRRPARALPSI